MFRLRNEKITFIQHFRLLDLVTLLIIQSGYVVFIQ